jgi:protein CpxP
MRTEKTLRNTTLAIAIGALLGTTFALAGPHDAGRDPAAGVDDRIEWMTENLDLTAEQQSEIRTILEEQRAQAERQREETRERVDAVLTPEQLARIDERREAGMERRLDRLAEQLDLTEDQITQVRALMPAKGSETSMDRAQIREQIKAVLTEEQRTKFEAMGPDKKRGGPDKPRGEDQSRGGLEPAS